MAQRKLARLMSAINEALASQDATLALRLIMANFESLEDPALLRERVALVLAQLGRKKEALQVFEVVGRHYANGGYPARAIAAVKQMQQLNPDTNVLLDHIATLYSIRSPFAAAHSSPPRFPEPDEVTMEPEDHGETLDELLDDALERALDHTGLRREPEDLPTVPLLGLLPQKTFRKVLDHLEYELFDAPAKIASSGEKMNELVWAASDDLVVRDGDEAFFLQAGALVGLSSFGQSARAPEVDVIAGPGGEILRLPAEAIDRISREVPDFQNRLATLRRHAMTERLLHRHPMFEELDEQTRMDVIETFTGMRVASGEKIIAQSEPSPGLFIILDGQVDIVRNDEDWEITIATLRAGEVFGEIGLVADQPAVAGCVMTDDGHLLHLPRRDFDSLAERFPSVARYTAALARERLSEATLSAEDLAEVE